MARAPSDSTLCLLALTLLSAAASTKLLPLWFCPETPTLRSILGSSLSHASFKHFLLDWLSLWVLFLILRPQGGLRLLWLMGFLSLGQGLFLWRMDTSLIRPIALLLNIPQVSCYGGLSGLVFGCGLFWALNQFKTLRAKAVLGLLILKLILDFWASRQGPPLFSHNDFTPVYGLHPLGAMLGLMFFGLERLHAFGRNLRRNTPD